MLGCLTIETIPPTVWRLGAEKEVSMPLSPPSEVKSPVISDTGIDISVAPVATAMEPEYVLQDARLEASALFVRVKVPAVLHPEPEPEDPEDCAVVQRQRCNLARLISIPEQVESSSSFVLKVSLTIGARDEGNRRNGELD